MNIPKERDYAVQIVVFVFGVLICGIGAALLLITGIGYVIDPISAHERRSGAIGSVAGIVLATVCIGSSYLVLTGWWPHSATVATILTSESHTMVLTSSGTLYSCQAATECTTLKPGQLITFESRTAGGAFGQPVIRNVRVG